MYEITVEIWNNPLEEPEIWQGGADDYEDAVTNAAELAEAEEPYKTVITITKEV